MRSRVREGMNWGEGMLCRVCGDRPHWAPASMAGWPPAIGPSLILQTCTSLDSLPWQTASQKTWILICLPTSLY